MRSRDVQDELTDDFQPGPLPPMGADGAPKLEKVRDLPVDPPRLCEAGPCRHYHVMQIQMDAQQPERERRQDGTLVDHGRVFHVETHHYCYPDVGIETNLGGAPVLSCNRWTPITRLFRGKRRIKREYDRKLEAFHHERDAAIVDAEPVTSPVVAYVTVEGGDLVSVKVDAAPADDILAVLARAGAEVDLERHFIELDGAPIFNLTATVEELGLPLEQPTASGAVEVNLSVRKIINPKENV